MEDGKEAMSSCPHHRPLLALPYFSPSCQGTTGLLANLDFSIEQPLSSCLGAATACGAHVQLCF